MALTDFLKNRQAVSSSVGSNRGLSGWLTNRMNGDDEQKELDSRINNAETRLSAEGIDTPEPSGGHKGIFQKLLDALNYLNNKKNQGLYGLSHGFDDVPEEVGGQDLVRDWAGKDFKGSGAVGFLFDVLTDPLNFLSFGTAGAAAGATRASLKAGLKAGQGIRRAGLGTKAVKAGEHASDLKGLLDELATPPVAAASDKPRGPMKNFIDRLMGPEGENLRWVQMKAMKEVEETGYTGDITHIEEKYARSKGWKLEDLYNEVYKETGGYDRFYSPSKPKEPQLELPIDEAAPKPWKTDWYARQGKVEEVSTDWLSRLPGNPLRHSPEKLAELEADIAKNGIKEPVMIQIGQQDRNVRLAEGNHRLAIAKKLGYKYIPVRVLRQQRVLDGGMIDDAMSKVPEFEYFPGDARPSQVFDEVPIRPVTNSMDEIAAGKAPVEDLQRAGPPGSTPPGQLPLKEPTPPNRYFAQLGGHIPFTDIGGYFKIPGSETLVTGAVDAAKAGVSALGNTLGKIPGATEFGKAARDFMGRTFKVGYGVPAFVNQITQRAAELTRMDAKDIVNNLVEIQKGWVSKGYVPGQDDIDIIKALEDPSHLDKLRPDQADMAKTVRDFFDMHFLKAEEAEVLDDFVANYIPHIFRGKESEVKAALEQLRRKSARMKTKPGFANERKMGFSLDEILNDPVLKKKLDPETNIIKIMAIYKSGLEKAIRNKDMITELASLGPDIIRKDTFDFIDPKSGKTIKRKALIPTGWVQAPIAQLKNYWVPPEIANHLKDTVEPFINNTTFKQFMKYHDTLMGWWKGMATVPNPGFQIRNQLGNMFNNYLAGVRNLKHYITARTVQQADDTTMDEFYDLVQTLDRRPEWAQGTPVTGVPSASAMADIGPSILGAPDPRDAIMSRVFNSNRFNFKFFEGDGPKFKVVWDGKERMVNSTGMKFLAKLYGVSGLGFYSGDLGEHILKKLDPVSNLQKINPLSTNNVMFKSMERMGSALEDNARIAHFMAKLAENGGDLYKASESVKKYLFDYTRLTPMEKGVFKAFMPFYAFTRNNIPLQVKELIRQPKYASFMATLQNWGDTMAEEELDTDFDRNDISKFMSQLYSVRLPFQVGDDTKDVIAGFDLPIRDVNSFSPSEWSSMVTPLLTTPFQIWANRNLYNGQELEEYEGQTVRAPGYLQGIFKTLQMAGPDDPDANIFNQFFKWAPGTTVATDEEGNPELRISPTVSLLLNQIVSTKNLGKSIDVASGDADPLGLSSLLTGVNVISSSEQDRHTTHKYRQLTALEDLIQKLKDEGRPVATLDELEPQDPSARLRKLLGL